MAIQEIQKINLVNSDINNELINSKNLTNFRPSVIDESKEEVNNWEEELMMNLISMKKLKEDDNKTLYAKFKKYKNKIYGLALVDTGNLVTSNGVFKEFWETLKGKMSGTSNARVGTVEKGGKGLKVLGKGVTFKFYLNRLDQLFEVEPIVIEGLNHAVNLEL